MKTYKQLRRIRKIKKFGKKVGIAILFLVVSYLLSLLSFYLYTQLSQILQPVEKGFLGFAIIGLIAGFIAILVSFLNKRLILTVVISFAIDCLVDSVILYSKLGTQVIQYLPGLLVSMSSVLASWHFLKRKLWSPKNCTQSAREQFNKKYALARKLLENPSKLTLDVFKEACEALRGIDPKIDRLLKEADHVSRAISFINGGNPIGLTVSLIPVKTEKHKEKKEKLLFFIDLVNDIWEEVNVAYVRLNAGNPGNYVDHPVRQLGNNIVASSGPSGIATISMAFVVATSVAASNTANIGSILRKNDFLPPETQDSQEIIIPSQTATPTILPTVTPKTVQILTYSTVEKTIFVSATEEGTTFTVGSTGTYRFTITGGAYMADPAKGWEAKVMIYKNRSVDWSGPNNTHTNWDYLVGYPGDYYTDLKTREEAEQLGKGQKIDIFLNKNDYLIFLVFDSKGNFVDNSGGMYIQVQKGTLVTPTTQAVSEIQGFQYYAECDNSSTVPVNQQNFLNIFGDGKPERPLVNTVDLSSGKSYWVRMSIGFDKPNGKEEAIANKNNITFNVTLDDRELTLKEDIKLEYFYFWELKGYYCTGILEKGSHKVVGTSYLSGNYVDSATLILNAI